jgi:hypothetical protein
MGKTNPTYRDHVQAWANDFEAFQRALVYDRQSAAAEIVAHAHQVAAAGGNYNATDPMETILLSICIGQQEEIQELRDRVDELDAEG